MSDYREYIMRMEETKALAANVDAPILKQALLELMTAYRILAHHAADREDEADAPDEHYPAAFYGALIGRPDRWHG